MFHKKKLSADKQAQHDKEDSATRKPTEPPLQKSSSIGDLLHSVIDFVTDSHNSLKRRKRHDECKSPHIEEAEAIPNILIEESPFVPVMKNSKSSSRFSVP